MKKLDVIFVLAIAACGGGKSKPAAEQPAPGSSTTPDPVAQPEPPKSAEPEKPGEPAPPAPDPKAELLAAEMAAYETAKPVFDKWCAKCHAEGGKMATKKKRDHFDMTKYPFGGHHAMEMSQEIRKSLGIGGGKPTMPFDKKGAVKGEELTAIAAWADAFDAAHAAGAHQRAGHDHGGHEH